MMKSLKIPATILATCILFLLATAGATIAAVGDHLWSINQPAGGETSRDATDNIVMYGAFYGTIDLGGGPMTSTNFVHGDQYLARFDATGQFLWSHQFSVATAGFTGLKVAVDAAGNSYIAGRTFPGTALDFGGGPVADNEVYIAKFDVNGVLQWSGSHGEGWVVDLAADNARVAITGYTSTGMDFGGGSIGTAGNSDIYVAQLNAAGSHDWSAGFGDTSAQDGRLIALDGAGNVLLAGFASGTVDFGGGPLVALGSDLWLASFTSSGGHNWSTIVSGSFTLGDIAAGPSGELALVGDLDNSADFGGGLLISNGSLDVFCAVFEANGTHRWSANWGSTDEFDSAEGVAIDGSGKILLTGYIRGDTDFGGGIIPFTIGDPLDLETGLFIALYEADGTHLYSAGYGLKARGTSCSFDSNGDLSIDGRTSLPLDLGGGTLPATGNFWARFEGPGGGVSSVPESPLFGGSLNGYPNPFNPLTTIAYTVDQAAPVAVAAYDIRGRLVADLVPERWHHVGEHRVQFSPQASGVYFVRMRRGTQVRSVKMVAIK